MPEWLSAFQSVAFKEGSNTQSIEEDNELYCPSGEGMLYYFFYLMSDINYITLFGTYLKICYVEFFFCFGRVNAR